MKYWTKLFLKVSGEHLFWFLLLALFASVAVGISWLVVTYPKIMIIVSGITIPVLSIAEQMYRQHKGNKQ